MTLSFGEFTVDADRRLLLRGGAEVPLAPRAFDLLVLLLEARPRPLSKQTIFDRLWPDSFVTDNGLATIVADIRAATRDPARRPRFIRTIHGHGYAFVGDVIVASPARARPPAAWALVWREREIPLPDGEHVVGRPGPGVIAIDSPTVSRHHARLVVAGGAVTVEDLGSKNGTWLDGRAVTAAVPVHGSAELRLGRVVLALRHGHGWASTASVTSGRGTS